MNYSLLALLARQPQLLMDHAQAYAGLINVEFVLAYASWRRRSLLLVVALICLATAAVLGGCALMLWAITPGLDIFGQRVLLFTPLVSFVGALACWGMAVSQVAVDPFANLKMQVNADVALLRAAQAP